MSSDPNMPRAEFDQTGRGEKAGMMLAAASFGATGIKGLYSRVNKAIQEFPGKQINANRALNTLRNSASKEELDYRGLADFLQGQQGKSIPTANIQEAAEARTFRSAVVE